MKEGDGEANKMVRREHEKNNEKKHFQQSTSSSVGVMARDDAANNMRERMGNHW